jgi:hypothetical protein
MRDPIFIVAAPRSGGAFLEETLAHAAEVVVAPGRIDRTIAELCGGRDRLTAQDATPPITAALRDALAKIAGDSRLADASPQNAACVPFLHAVFPAATFVYVYREPRRAVFDMREATGFSAEELARQWNAATAMLLDDLQRLPPAAWLVAGYRELTENLTQTIARLAAFLGIAWSGARRTSSAAFPSLSAWKSGSAVSMSSTCALARWSRFCVSKATCARSSTSRFCMDCGFRSCSSSTRRSWRRRTRCRLKRCRSSEFRLRAKRPIR